MTLPVRLRPILFDVVIGFDEDVTNEKALKDDGLQIQHKGAHEDEAKERDLPLVR